MYCARYVHSVRSEARPFSVRRKVPVGVQPFMPEEQSICRTMLPSAVEYTVTIWLAMSTSMA